MKVNNIKNIIEESTKTPIDLHIRSNVKWIIFCQGSVDVMDITRRSIVHTTKLPTWNEILKNLKLHQ